MTPDCSTCGLAVDWSRSCRLSSFRLFANRPDLVTRGRFYFCGDDTPFMPIPHYFGNGTWATEQGSNLDGLGEVMDGPKPWSGGVLGVTPPPAVRVGNDGCFAGGDSYPPLTAGRTLPMGVDSRCYAQAGLAVPVAPMGGPIVWMRPEGIPAASPGDPVPLWKDSSGRGNHLTLITVARQPLYLNPGPGGLVGLDFQPTGFIPKALVWGFNPPADQVPVLLGDAWSLYIAFQLSGTLGGLDGPSVVGAPGPGVVQLSGHSQLITAATSLQSFSVALSLTPGSVHLFAVRKGGGSIELSVDGLAVLTSACSEPSTGDLASFTAFPLTPGSTRGLKTGEFLAYDWRVDDDNHNANVAYLRSRYGF